SSVLAAIDKGFFFSTTSAQYFVHSSTTIPKTYTANTFNALQTLSSGLLATASSTIGGGTQSTGLTISGGATTTGNMYIGSKLGIGIQPSTYELDINGAARFLGNALASSFIVGDNGANFDLRFRPGNSNGSIQFFESA